VVPAVFCGLEVGVAVVASVLLSLFITLEPRVE